MSNKGITQRVAGEKTEFIVQHKGGGLSFLCSHACVLSKGKTFVETKKYLQEKGLIFPTLAEIASIVYAAYQSPKEEYSKRVIELLERESVWANNGILAVPKKGLYIQDSPEVKWGKNLNESELEEKLDAGDPSVRLVTSDYEAFEQSPQDLAKHKLLIELAGEEGAEKLAYVAAKYPGKQHCVPIGARLNCDIYARPSSEVISLCSRKNIMIMGEDIKLIPNNCFSFALIRK